VNKALRVKRYAQKTVGWDVRDGPGGCQYWRRWAKSESSWFTK